MKDRLEEFFRKKLTEPQKGEAWNVPSDDVWEMARAHFDAPRRRRRRFFILFFLLLATAGMGLFFFRKVAGKKTVHKAQENIAIHPLPENRPGPDEINLTREVDILPPLQSQRTPEPRPRSTPAHKTRLSGSGGRLVMTPASAAMNERFASAHSTITAASANQKVNPPRPAAQRKHLEVLTPLRPIAGVQPEKPSLAGFPLPVIKHATARRRLAVTIFDVPLTAGFADVADMTFGNPAGPAHAFGAGVEYAIDRHWWLGLGVSVLNLHSQTVFSGSQNYDAATEYYIGGGMMANDVSFQTASSLGERSFMATLVHSNMNPIPQGTQLEAKLTTTHHLTYLNVPVEIVYRTTGGRRLSFFAGAGPEMNRLLVQRSVKTGKVFHLDEPMEMIGMQASPVNVNTKNWWSAHLKTGLDYRLLPTLSVYSSLRYRYGITPFLTSANVAVHYQAAGLEVGLRWAIREK